MKTKIITNLGGLNSSWIVTYMQAILWIWGKPPAIWL